MRSFSTIILIISIILLISPAGRIIFADEMLTITVGEGQSLREIAESYLNNPNLWVDILRVNNLSSAAEVKSGMKLKIPANAVSRANQQMASALELIDKATMNGARLFAPSYIDEASGYLDQAKSAKNTGNWEECWSLAVQSSEQAKYALKICEENQNVPAQAAIYFRKGMVQAHGIESRAWLNAPINQILLEGDKVRTLSESNAGIRFRDESRLRLEENSLAAIQKMRYNNLQKSEESSISLLQGDIFAFLGGARKGERFELNIEGVDTKINSSQFWVSKDEEAARFANYDGELSVTSLGQTLTMGVNQGSIISGGKASLISKLLPQPKLISPDIFARVYHKKIDLRWEPVEAAQRYWLEIANDKSFNHLLLSKKDIRSPSFLHQNVPQELYYWRVAAIDKYGLPGPKSEVRVVAVIHDEIPPYLLVTSPKHNSIVNTPSQEIVGESEIEAVVLLNKDTLRVAPDGVFRVTVTLKPGDNTFLFLAFDLADNESDQELTIHYLPDPEQRASSFKSGMSQVDDNTFKAQAGGFTLRGQTLKGNRVTVASLQTKFKASTIADETGAFQLNVPLKLAKEDFELSEETLTGLKSSERFTVTVDDNMPVIHLESPLPVVTSDKELDITGRIGEGNRLLINDEETQLADDQFTKKIPLKTGMNRIRFEALDDVRNVTIIERNIVRDIEPPTVEKIDLSPKTARTGDRIVITVTAKDMSGMKRAAPYTIQIGSFTYNGFLELARGEDEFRGAFTVPEQASGAVRLKSLILEDYFGNRKEYVY